MAARVPSAVDAGLLSAQQVAAFHEQGFVIQPRITTVDEVSTLLKIFERLFSVRAGRSEGCHYDLVGLDRDEDKLSLPSISNPVNYAPELRFLTFRERAAAIAKQLIGPEATASFEHAILKPASYGAPTPWHQDEAYRVDPNFAYNQISFWLPLGAATLENGCMHYIPRSNQGAVLAHQSFKDDARIHAIECIGDFDAATACACPLAAGDAVIHHGRTLHYAGSNLTDKPRYAYILAFEAPPRRLEHKRDFAWNRLKQTRSRQQRSLWRKRGGIAIEAIRKYRHGMLSSPARFMFELRRGINALLHRND